MQYLYLYSPNKYDLVCFSLYIKDRNHNCCTVNLGLIDHMWLQHIKKKSILNNFV